MCLAEVEKRPEGVLYLLQFMCIFAVGELYLFEHSPRIHKVSGIDAHFLHLFGGGKSCLGIEMYVGH